MRSAKFYVPIYRANVTVYFAEDLKVIQEKYNTFDLSNFGAVALRNDKHHKEYIVAFTSENDFGLIAHEVVHLKNYIFLDIGQDLDLKNDEAEAYLTGFLFDKIYEFLNKNK